MSICAAQSSCLQNGRNASTSSWEESIRQGMWLEQAMLKHAHGVLIIFITIVIRSGQPACPGGTSGSCVGLGVQV